MNALLIARLLGSMLAGGASASAPPAQPGADPNALAVILASLAAQRFDATPPAVPPEQRGSGFVEGVVIAAFILAMFATAAIGIYMQSPITSLAVLAFGLGVLASKFGTIVDFRFGSSWGSRQKDAWRPSGGQGAPIVIPSPPAIPPPETPSGEPPDGEVKPSEPSIPGIGPSTDPSTADKRADIPYDGSTPASIRYNNPGAQYPSAEAARFGQIGYGVIGGGHKIARFPHPVNGAASNFDLLRRKYVGMTIGEAGKKWTGANSFGVPGYHDAVVLTAEMIDDRSLAIPFMKAIARREAGRDSPVTDTEWNAAHAMFRAGSADAWLASNGAGAPVETRATGADLLRIASAHIGEEYVLGARAPKDDANYKGPWDCAELVSWVIYQAAGIPYGWTDNSASPAQGDAYTGAFQRDAQTIGKMISVSQAAATPGAILLRYPTGGMGHIVFSDGKGGTVEAMSANAGVTTGKVAGRRWDTGILIPGIAYDGQSAVAVSPPVKLYAIGQPNMRADVVTSIQSALADKGFAVSVDGEYGPETAQAVAAFQRREGVIDDGEVGEVTAPLLGVTL